jgi:hypothetical protein
MDRPMWSLPAWVVAPTHRGSAQPSMRVWCADYVQVILQTKRAIVMTASPLQPSTRESLDGSAAGDHDAPYVFGRLPRALAPFPFSTRELARLMVMRSRVHAGLYGIDDGVPQLA